MARCSQSRHRGEGGNGLLIMKRKYAADEIESELQRVDATLKAARKHGLEAEDMWSALIMAAEANEHGRTMAEVLYAAQAEWDI